VNQIAFIGGVPPEFVYPVVFAVALGKSAALPLPGTTTLIAAVALARDGSALLPVLFACAVAGAIVGGHIGYLAGARGGRWALTRSGRWERHRAEGLRRGELFWARHGVTTVVVARLFPVLRHLGGLLAGMNAMPLRRFAPANALGAVLWALWGTGIALLVGTAAGGTVGPLGTAALAVALAGALGAVVARRALGASKL
jgi:membrane protein DedA with SNARE-associated domain